MKILLLGPDGQVGWELRRALAPLGALTILGRSGHPDGLSGNLADPGALTTALRALRPDVVVNAAAYTAVDKAESDVEAATVVNASAPGLIARELANWSGWLVHYSTDYVFDGTGTAPRDELAATGPLGVYGRTKLEGEEAIRSSGCRHLILRTSWVHAARGGNFARTMLRLASQRDTLSVVDDQVGAPTGADLLADVTAHALRAAVRDTALSGTYHACASGAVSWCDYARHVIDWGHRTGLPLKARSDSVRGIPTSEYPSPAARPLNSRLDTRKLCHSFGLTMPDWRMGVDRMLVEALPTLMPASA